MIRNFTPDRAEKTRASKPALSFVRTEDKVRSIWQYLKRYEDPSFVEGRISSDYPAVNAALREKKAKHIADCVRQAEEYFKTANTSDLSIKPLILYYGMLDLAKALMLFGDNALTLEDNTLKLEGLNSHGLTHGTKHAADEAIRDDVNNLLEEFCYTPSSRRRNTVFSLLHECWSTTTLAAGTKVVLGDLLAAHPSTWRSYADHTMRAPKYFKSESSFRTTVNGDEHFLKFDSTFQFNTYGFTPSTAVSANQWLQQQLPKLASLYIGDNTYSPYGYIHAGKPTSLEGYQPTYKFSTGESYTMADVVSGVALHPVEIEFLTMFILGSLTRYAPQKWLTNVQYQGRGEMFVVEGVINSAPTTFPKMILEELDNREYTFTGDAAYFG